MSGRKLNPDEQKLHQAALSSSEKASPTNSRVIITVLIALSMDRHYPQKMLKRSSRMPLREQLLSTSCWGR
jgi:hypothetical protein